MYNNSSIGALSSTACDFKFLLKHLSNSVPCIKEMSSSIGRKRQLLENGYDVPFWRLLSSLTALFLGLVESKGHRVRQEQAVGRFPEVSIQESLGRIVRLIIQILQVCSSFRPEKLDPEDYVNRKESIHNLQSLLVKVCLLVYSRCVLDLLTLWILDERHDAKPSIFGFCGSSNVLTSK